MEAMDLDIQNYNLDEILELFKVSYDFDETELKKAHKMYLMTHPDKSNLNPNIFLFFGKAYDILRKIYEFRNKKQRDYKKYETINLEKDKKFLLEKLNGKSVKEFNSWFNEMFDKVKVGDQHTDSGYGDWYNNYKDKEVNRVPMSEFQNEFNKKKESLGIVVRQEVQDINTGNGYSLDRNCPENYSSGIFSKLTYEDLKKAHTETIVPVSKKDFENKKQFNSIEKYKEHRSNQNTQPLSLQQSKAFLKEKENKHVEEDTRRVYSILKQDEETAKSNKQFWGYLKQLE
jgi:hypothetical protein